ncbi:MAG: permease-like cell division protein FtsX [Bacillota bacterium]|nr:permease-like cell division protein FtsX [Bacillota bacterium]
MRLTTVWYFLAEGWRSARRNVSLISLGTIAASLFVLGALALILMNLDHISQSLQARIEIRAFLEDGLSPEGVAAVREQIRGTDGVAQVAFVSKDEGLRRLRGQLGERAGLLDVVGDNPLPDAFDVRVEDPERTSEVAARISRIPGVLGVNYGQGFTEKLLATMRLVGVAGAAVAALFVAAVVFIVGNTVRLTVISRAREIEVMKLVGATDWFIRWPFLVEGMVVGLVGAAISGLLLFACYKVGVRYVAALAPFIPVITAPEPVAALCVALLLMGVLMGIVAGGVFVKRYLRV